MDMHGENDVPYPRPGAGGDSGPVPPNPDGSEHGPQHHNALHEYVSQNGVQNGVETGADSAATYLDWASQFLLDGGNNDLLAGLDFASAPVSQNNSIMHKIQFQNSVHDQSSKSSDSGIGYVGSPHLQQTIQSPPSPPLLPLVPQISGAPPKPPVDMSSAKITAGQRQEPVGSIAVGTGRDARQKSRRPCDHCRRKKIRCVIIPDTENCAQCEAKSLTCTYTRQGGSNAEQAAKRARNAASSAEFVDPNPVPTNMYESIVPPNVPIRNVAPVQDYSTMNHSLLKKTLSLQFPRSSFYVGPTSYLFDTNLLEVIMGAQNKQSGPGRVTGRPATLNKIEQVNLSEKISLRKVENKTQFVLQDDQTKQSIQTMSNDVDAIEKFIAPHGQILIDLYFRIIHPSYPVLHKKVFLEKYSRTHREFSAPLLAAVYVLAIQWWDYDPQLNRFPKPNVELILRIGLKNYILEILKRPKLSAVQAGLLLLQCKHIFRGINSAHAPPGEYGSASASLTSAFNEADYNDWVLCSQVVAISEELGLGLDCDGWKLPKWERGLRKRLAWAVYLEDKWLALKNSRPSHINDLNWVVSDLAEEDFPEKHGDGDLKEGSSDINNGKKNFMNLINLSKILSEILNSLFSMKAMKEITDINEVLRIAKPIQLKLRTWYHSLPIELQMNSVQPRKLCSNGYLQLAYFAAELTLHRKIITTLYQQNIHGSKIPDELLNVCRSAARTRLIASIEFVKDLKPEHIHSFWHSSAASNFTLIGTFAALLFISSSSKEEARDFKERVYDYRWVLKISAKGFIQIGDSLQKLDLVMNHIPGLLNESNEQPLTIPNVPIIDYNKALQQQQIPKHSVVSKQSPLSQHLQYLPQSPASQLHHSPQQPQMPKSVSQQEQYNKSSPANDQRPYLQDHNSSQGVSPYTGSSFGPGTSATGSTAPGSAPTHKVPSQTPHLPFDSSQAFQGQNYHPQQGMGSVRNTPVSMNSPQSVSGRSPKDTARQQRVNFPKSTQSDAGSSHSTPGQGHGAETHTKTEVGSSKNSPMLVRSPHTQHHNAKVDEAASEAGN